jgi:hypothetical protein
LFDDIASRSRVWPTAAMAASFSFSLFTMGPDGRMVATPVGGGGGGGGGPPLPFLALLNGLLTGAMPGGMPGGGDLAAALAASMAPQERPAAESAIDALPPVAVTEGGAEGEVKAGTACSV